MKQIIVAIAAMAASAALYAQTEKGDVLVGGNLGFQTGENSNQFNLSPNIGFFVAKNFALGAALNFNSSKQGNISSSTFGLGPFARYYFGQTMTKPFLVTEVDFLSTTIKTGESKLSNNGFGWLLGLGFAAFINESVAVEAVSGYNYNKFKNVDGSGGFALRLGFQVYLGKGSASALRTNVLGN